MNTLMLGGVFFMQNQKNSFPADGIIVPPGCESSLLTNSGEKVQTYTPSSYHPYTPKVPPHSMRGRTDSLSMPKNPTPEIRKSIADYLSQFQGATLCLDLWTSNRQKWKRCGVLLEVGNDFLVMGDNTSNSISIVDLKPIRYINIYCK